MTADVWLEILFVNHRRYVTVGFVSSFGHRASFDDSKLLKEKSQDLEEGISELPKNAESNKTCVIFHRSVAAAALSGVVGAFIGSPFYMVKTQLQVGFRCPIWFGRR